MAAVEAAQRHWGAVNARTVVHQQHMLCNSLLEVRATRGRDFVYGHVRFGPILQVVDQTDQGLDRVR